MSQSKQSIAMRYALQRPAFELDVELTLPMHGITGIFGRSGAGKTTLLRCIAGLESTPNGSLEVAGERWQQGDSSLPTHKRDLGYVFQEPRLFAHLDVRRNLEFGMRRGNSNADGVSFVQVVELLGVQHLLQRMPGSLSGGEAQRVAIGRVLLRNPRFILMDEPLASLERERRAELLPFLERLHAELAVPVVYVSHSLEEICRLCDQLAVLHEGRVLASGSLQDVLMQTGLPGIGGQEAGAVLDAEVVEADARFELTRVQTSGGDFLVSGVHETGTRLRLRVRANDVSLCRSRPEDTTILNVLPARVISVEADAAGTELVWLQLGSDRLVARVTRRSRTELQIQPGDDVLAQVKSVAVRQAPTQSAL